jgi:hypothetical protein
VTQKYSFAKRRSINLECGYGKSALDSPDVRCAPSPLLPFTAPISSIFGFCNFFLIHNKLFIFLLLRETNSRTSLYERLSIDHVTSFRESSMKIARRLFIEMTKHQSSKIPGAEKSTIRYFLGLLEMKTSDSFADIAF